MRPFRPLTALSLCAVLAAAACTQPTDTAAPAAEISRASTDAGYSDADFTCLREAVYFEAGARSFDGGRAVAHVILNRAQDPRFPNSICGVIAEGQSRGACQFSYRCDGRAEVFADQIKLANATKAARAVLENPADDVSGGALFFHAQWMKPGWFATLKRTVALGGNIFYR